jgi:hypothetical protein
MGNRNIGKREQKKPKKDSKKTPQINISEPQMQVEIIRKGKKIKDEEEV